jgi:hypothetical protein
MYESIERTLVRIYLESDRNLDKALKKVMIECPALDEEWGIEAVREMYEDEELMAELLEYANG